MQFAIEGRHCSLCPYVTNILRLERVYLYPNAAIISCGRMSQHSHRPREPSISGKSKTKLSHYYMCNKEIPKTVMTTAMISNKIVPWSQQTINVCMKPLCNFKLFQIYKFPVSDGK